MPRSVHYKPAKQKGHKDPMNETIQNRAPQTAENKADPSIRMPSLTDTFLTSIQYVQGEKHLRIQELKLKRKQPSIISSPKKQTLEKIASRRVSALNI
jgi:hypothetical protein